MFSKSLSALASHCRHSGSAALIEHLAFAFNGGKETVSLLAKLLYFSRGVDKNIHRPGAQTKNRVNFNGALQRRAAAFHLHKNIKVASRLGGSPRMRAEHDNAARIKPLDNSIFDVLDEPAIDWGHGKIISG